MLMIWPAWINMSELPHPFAPSSEPSETQNFLRMLKIESPRATLYVPAGRGSQPGVLGPAEPVGAMTTCGLLIIAVGGIFRL